MQHEHTFDRRHIRFAEGEAVHCLDCDALVIPRPRTVVQESPADISAYIAQLCSKVGVYYCPVCKSPDSDSKRHAEMNPACVLEAHAAAVGVVYA